MRSLRTFLSAAVGTALLATAAYALTAPPSFNPRMFPDQQTHYLRFTANFNSCTLAAN